MHPKFPEPGFEDSTDCDWCAPMPNCYCRGIRLFGEFCLAAFVWWMAS